MVELVSRVTEDVGESNVGTVVGAGDLVKLPTENHHSDVGPRTPFTCYNILGVSRVALDFNSSRSRGSNPSESHCKGGKLRSVVAEVVGEDVAGSTASPTTSPQKSREKPSDGSETVTPQPARASERSVSGV